MDCRKCLVLHKNEWDRLIKQRGEIKKCPEEIHYEEKKEYLKALDEQSLKWKQNWPDTVEGVMKKLENIKEKQRKKNEEFVKAFRDSEEQKKRQNYSAVAEAKEKIFNSTSYGKELMSALLESKVIEEREAQIEFKKVIEKDRKEQEDALQFKIVSMSNNLYNFYKKDEDSVIKRKQKTEEHSKINKIMHEKLTEKIEKAKREEQQLELEDTRLMEQLLNYEKHESEHCKEQHKREHEQYLEDQKAFREAKQKRERLNDDLAKVWQNYQDRIRCQEKLVWQKIINEKITSNQHKELYDMIQNAHENEKKTYEDFVNKGIKEANARVLEEDTILAKKKEGLHKELQMQVAEDGRRAEETNKWNRHCDMPYSNRTCIISKSLHKVVNSDVKDKDAQKPPSFLAPKNKLLEALKKRKKQPTEWTALKGSHQYFAEKANSTLKECKYKKMAQKVVDKYKKPLKDDDIAQTLAAMLSESSEDDEGEEFGCRDGPYPDFDMNKALDKVEDSFSLEELKSVLESNSGKSSEFAPCCYTAAPETRKRSASKLHPCDQITTRKLPRKMSSTYANPQMRNIKLPQPARGDTAAPEKRKRSASKSHPCDQIIMCKICLVPLCIIPCYENFHINQY